MNHSLHEQMRHEEMPRQCFINLTQYKLFRLRWISFQTIEKESLVTAY